MEKKMVSETKTTNETSDQQPNSIIPWLILIVLIVLVCCCCAVVISGWFLGDLVLQTFEQILQGYY